MNVLLICPKVEISIRTLSAPLGILSVATYLNENGHNVKFIDKAICKCDIDKIIKDFQPDIIGISMMSAKTIQDVLKICKTAKSHNIPVVCGGTLSSLIPELVLSSGVVDYVVINEGEITMLELINSISKNIPLSKVDGLAFIENGRIVINKNREFSDLASLPVIDWSLVDPTKYFRAYFGCKKMLYLYGGKGCPNQCTFCFNKEYHRCTYRKRPTEYVIKEIEYLVRHCALDGVYFSDENFFGTKTEMHLICDQIKKSGLDFVWGCQTRINGFSVEDFKYMYDSGCRWIFFGIESGSKTILTKIKKGIAYDKIVETVSNCYKAGIVVITAFIVGFPDETEEELHQTVELAQKFPFAMRSINHFFPDPGSELYSSLIDEGRYQLPQTLNDLAMRETLGGCLEKNFSKISTRDLNVVYSYFMMSTFLRKNTIESAKPFDFTKKIIREQLRDMAKDGFVMFFKNLVLTAKTFLTYLYYYIFFPGIRKKYGLYSREKGKNTT